MTAPAQTTPRELVIRDLEGQTTTIALDRDRITLGRSSANELSYPDDIGLSRQHLAIVGRDGQWTVEDLGSKNGTLLNGVRIEKPMPFGPGDRVSAGHLTIEFAGSGGASQNTVDVRGQQRAILEQRDHGGRQPRRGSRTARRRSQQDHRDAGQRRRCGR